MADGTAAPYDYSKDPAFLSAPISTQHAYLMENEPDYAKAGPTDQDRYLSHLKEGAPSPVAPQPLAGRMRTAWEGPEMPKDLQGKEMYAQPVPVPFGVAKLPFAAAMRVLGGGAAGAAGGAAVGGYGGGEVTGIFSKNPKTRELGHRIGAAIGAAVGGYGGAKGALPQEAPVVDEVAQAVRERRANWLPTKVKPPLAEQIAAKEAGAQPPVTKVPIRPEPTSPLTPEQVPGPDTPGKGNLLSPAARRGDPRAGQELMRRGRQVLYVPAEEYPGTRLSGTLEERMGQPPQPRSPRPESEVMMQSSGATTRSAPPMAQESPTATRLWEGLSEQGAAPATGQSPLADRIAAERGMVEHTPEDLNAAKEARRQQFEKPDLSRYKRKESR